jgi:hypothetical protein
LAAELESGAMHFFASLKAIALVNKASILVYGNLKDYLGGLAPTKTYKVEILLV